MIFMYLFHQLVNNKLIAESSLNGIFIKSHLDIPVSELDRYICDYAFETSEILESNIERKTGKKVHHQIGTVCVYKSYLLTAFTKFDENNKAEITMPEYLEFLINFWDKVNTYTHRRVCRLQYLELV